MCVATPSDSSVTSFRVGRRVPEWVDSALECDAMHPLFSQQYRCCESDDPPNLLSCLTIAKQDTEQPDLKVAPRHRNETSREQLHNLGSIESEPRIGKCRGTRHPHLQGYVGDPSIPAIKDASFTLGSVNAAALIAQPLTEHIILVDANFGGHVATTASMTGWRPPSGNPGSYIFMLLRGYEIIKNF